jgi:hypothetical protein
MDRMRDRQGDHYYYGFADDDDGGKKGKSLATNERERDPES